MRQFVSRFLVDETGGARVEQVQQRAQTALAESPFHDLRRIRVDQHQGALQLNGRVSSFYYKQLAQELVRSVCREVEVVNAIDVHWSNDR